MCGNTGLSALRLKYFFYRFRKLSLKYHPDKNKNTPDVGTKFYEVAEAYDILSDGKDRHGAHSHQWCIMVSCRREEGSIRQIWR
jgi:curved DNA-binding protein CbpA